MLPLHHISIWLPFLNLGLQRYECFVNLQNYFQFFDIFLGFSTLIKKNLQSVDVEDAFKVVDFVLEDNCGESADGVSADRDLAAGFF